MKMTELGDRKNAEKSRPDLIPWHEFSAIAIDHGVKSVTEALKTWWAGRPYPLDLSIPTRQLPGIARVLAFGAAKYASRNWEKGLQFSSCFDSAIRHADKVAAGELENDESGLANESHFWTNVLFLVVFTARGRGDLDDRPVPVAAVTARLKALEDLTAQFRDLQRQYGPDPEPDTSGKAN